MASLLHRWIWRFWVVGELPARRLAAQAGAPGKPLGSRGGLILVGRSQLGFTALFVAIAAMMSAVLAQDVLYSGHELKAAVPAFIGYLVFSVALRFIPIVPGWAAVAGLLILAPFAPLLLTRYSIVDIVQRILGSFV